MLKQVRGFSGGLNFNKMSKVNNFTPPLLQKGGARKSNIRQRGIAALLIIIVISATALIMAYGAALLGLGELELGYTSQRGEEAFSVADGCMEETLRRIRLDTNYGVGAGTTTLTVSNGSCAIVVELSGSNGTTTVTGTSGDYNKKIQATYTLSGNVITIDSWEEKDD